MFLVLLALFCIKENNLDFISYYNILVAYLDKYQFFGITYINMNIFGRNQVYIESRAARLSDRMIDSIIKDMILRSLRTNVNT